MQRTARKKLGRALKVFSDWVMTHRHLWGLLLGIAGRVRRLMHGRG